MMDLRVEGAAVRPTLQSLGGEDKAPSDLRAAWSANRVGSDTHHVAVVLPSFSVAADALAHYASRIPALEHRYLLTMLGLPRIPGCDLVFLTCAEPEATVVDYYLRLLPPEARDSVRRRLHVVVVPDRSGRPIANKLLDRHDVLDWVAEFVGGRPGLVEAWNVTPAETEVARSIGLPIYGTPPEVWPVGFKSAGRRLFSLANIPVPPGREDVHTGEDVLEAVAWLQMTHPDSAGAVVKLDNSVAGDGNLVMPLRDADRPLTPAEMGSQWTAVPAWYKAALADGGVVEQLVTGDVWSSPSVQADITPDGQVHVLASHEQVMGGDNGQVYLGCRFPAEPGYAPELARHTQAIGEQLVEFGALGRYGVDFVVVRRAGRWCSYALEVNLRRGGTTHPFLALCHLAPGRYDTATATWRCDDGENRVYRSTDNLQDVRWRALTAAQVIDAIAVAGLEFDPSSRVGVVLHMLSGLPIDGRIGLTAIARDDLEAVALTDATREVLTSVGRPDAALRRPGSRPATAEPVSSA